MTTTVNWLIKGTLAVVTVIRPALGQLTASNGFPSPDVGMMAEYIMGPDGQRVMGTCMPTHPVSANVWRVWVQHPDTINEARDAWKKAAAAEREPTGCSHCGGSTIEPGSMFGAGSCHRCRR